MSAIPESYTTIQTYITDGTKTVYDIPFPYIPNHPEFVLVYTEQLQDNGLTVPESRVDLDFTFLDGQQIQLLATPVAGLQLTIRRETYADSILTQFIDGSMPTKYDLDLLGMQILNVAQEARDLNGQSLLVVMRYLEEMEKRFQRMIAQLEGVEDMLEKALSEIAVLLQEARLAADAALRALSLLYNFEASIDAMIREARREIQLEVASANLIAEDLFIRMLEQFINKSAELTGILDGARVDWERYVQRLTDIVNDAANTIRAEAQQTLMQAQEAADNSAQSAAAAYSEAERARSYIPGVIAAGAEQVTLATAQADRAYNEAERAISEGQNQVSLAADQVALAQQAAEDAREAGEEQAQVSAASAQDSIDAAALAQRWANQAPNVPVGPIGGREEFSAKHYAARAQATSNLEDHVLAYDPHPQYLRKDALGQNILVRDESGDIMPNPNMPDNPATDGFVFLDENRDIAFFAPGYEAYVPPDIPASPDATPTSTVHYNFTIPANATEVRLPLGGTYTEMQFMGGYIVSDNKVYPMLFGDQQLQKGISAYIDNGTSEVVILADGVDGGAGVVLIEYTGWVAST